MFKARKDALKFIEGVPRDLEIVNTGSTFAMYGFDYKYFPQKGFNFAMAPQPLSYDLKILEQYKSHISRDALVVITTICPFEFSVDDYEDDEHNYKYYFFLGKEKINGYSKIKEFMLKHFPLALSLRKPFVLVKSAIKKLIDYDRIRGKTKNTTANAKKNARTRIAGWKKQFNLPNVLDCKPDKKMLAIFEKTSDTLHEMLKLCVKNKFRPVILNMPVCKEESEEFSESVVEEFYNKNIRRANVYNVPVIDYFRDKRFHDHSLYINADCFNDRGREFFAEILLADLKRMGY